MFRMILRWLAKRGASANRRDLVRYIRFLEKASPRDRAIQLITANELRLAMITYIDSDNRIRSLIGRVLRDYPDVEERELLITPTYMDHVAIKFRKQKNLTMMAGWLLWMHTFRAVVQPKSRDLARRMWQLMSEAQPHVPALLDKVRADHRGSPFPRDTMEAACQWIPEGFEPGK